MFRKLTILSLFTIVTLMGCSQPTDPIIMEGQNVDPDTGKLIAFWLEYRDRSEPMFVTEPYAVFLVWIDDEKVFYLYDRDAKRTIKTEDFDVFLAELSKLPEGAAIENFVTCTVPRTYDMPDEAAARLTEIRSARNLTWTGVTEGLHCTMFCICEPSIRYPSEDRTPE